MSAAESPNALAEVEELPLADRADRYLALLEQLRSRLEDADAAAG